MATADHPHRAPGIGPATLKAFAHPLRMRLYDELQDHGPSTASQLARLLHESTGQTSYHLRQLEKHGLIAEKKGQGSARERWWTAQPYSFGLEEVETDVETRTAGSLIQQHVVRSRAQRLLAWIESQPTESPQWVAAAVSDATTARMSAPELEELARALTDVLEGHRQRLLARRAAEKEGSAQPPPDLRTVRVIVHAFPLPKRESDIGV